MTIHLIKRQIRQVCLAHRHSLSTPFVAEASAQIIHRIRQLACYQAAEHVAYYYPVHGEVDLSALWQLENGKTNCLPVIQPDKTLDFLACSAKTTWSKNRYGIPEPQVLTQKPMPLDTLDLIFIPVVAFDAHLNRLGSGAGYYDKTLSQGHHAVLAGVAYEWQKQDHIPREPWDRPLDLLITETNIYYRSAKEA